VSVHIWAICCKECKGWFFLCQGCFHGQRYCSAGCRREARRRQCRAAQKQYLTQLEARQRRAAASAAFRAKHVVSSGSTAAESATVKSNRSTCRLALSCVADRLPNKACCARCGVRGHVKPWR